VFGPGVKTRIAAAAANKIKVDQSGMTLYSSD